MALVKVCKSQRPSRQSRIDSYVRTTTAALQFLIQGGGKVSSEDSGQQSTDGLMEGQAELQIFISYRSDSDAPLASALRRLLEASIEPKPIIFIAGEGGLRPSNVGFKQQ